MKAWKPDDDPLRRIVSVKTDDNAIYLCVAQYSSSSNYFFSYHDTSINRYYAFSDTLEECMKMFFDSALVLSAQEDD